MKGKDSSRIKIEGLDYKDTGTSFIIFDVPIAAELVQEYDDGLVFKPADEISKIKVDNVPLTIVEDAPRHPAFLTGSNTEYKDRVVVGYMSEPSDDRANKRSEKKRYADYVLQKTELTEKLIEMYKDGTVIDTSIGFRCTEDHTPGEHQGVSYDYVQRDISLDHNAILMDKNGNIGTGRMPSPIGGIGADSMNKKKTKTNDAFASEINSLVTDLISTNPGLSRNDVILLLRDQLWELTDEGIKKMAKPTEDGAQEKVDALTKKNDELEAENAKLKADTKAKDAIAKLEDEKTQMQKDLDEKTAELKKHEDAAKKVIEDKRKELMEANEEHKDLFEKAEDDLIIAYHKKMQEKADEDNKGSRPIGADMMGAKGANNQSEAQRLARYNGSAKKEKGAE